VRAALGKRPTPKDEAHNDRMFITKYGTTWEPKAIMDCPVSKEMAKLLKELKIHRKGVGFYALRHTFQTIAGKTRDREAVRAIMGHVEDANDMSAVYTEEPVDDDRLRAVTDYVRAWLFPKPAPKGRAKAGPKA
jgi:integrase